MVRPKSVAEMLTQTEQNLSEKAYEALLKMLINREIPVNTCLQERRLAEILDISRTPVRDALNRLENEGFIGRAAGRTQVVKEFSTRELIETLNVRRTLEAEAARLSAGRVPRQELDDMEAQIRQLMADENPSSEKDWALDSQLHATMALYSENRLLVQYIETLRLKTRMFNLRQLPERFDAGHMEHLAIIEGLRSTNPVAAATAVSEHIDNVKESILYRLSII